MEEVIAKSVRKMYIVTYVITLVLSIFIGGIGALLAAVVDETEAAIIGWIFLVLGVVLAAASIAWLVYFVKMPENAVTLKDGKLYFRNGTVCSPTEMDYFNAKTMGLDGALFSFGKLTVSVKGKEFKIKFVDRVNEVANRLYMLKAEYSVKEHIANRQENEAEQPVQAEKENIREENNG